jgi:hypothetical protein
MSAGNSLFMTSPLQAQNLNKVGVANFDADIGTLVISSITTQDFRSISERFENHSTFAAASGSAGTVILRARQPRLFQSFNCQPMTLQQK